MTLEFADVYVQRTSHRTFLRHFHLAWEHALDDGCLAFTSLLEKVLWTGERFSGDRLCYTF